MTEIPMKSYWMGKDVETLSRKELIEVVQHLGRELDTTRAATRSIIEINELGRRARQRL